MKVLLIISFVLITLQSMAQSFGTQDTIKYLVKDISASTPPHDNIQFINNTGDTLHLRWVEFIESGFPSAWDLALQDPDNYYFSSPDSADFSLETPTSTTDKMITNLYHNNQAGNGRVRYKIYNINNLADSLNIYFDYTVTNNTHLGINSFSINQINHYQIDGQLVIRTLKNFNIDAIKIYTINGKLIETHESNQPYVVINVQAFQPGIYILQIKSDGNITYLKTSIN